MLLHWIWSGTLMPFTGKPKSGHDRAPKGGLSGREQLLAALCCGSLACFSFPCLKGALLTHLLQVLHLRSCPALPGNLQFALLQGLLLSRVKDLASVLMNFMKFLPTRKDIRCISANPLSFPSQEDLSYLSVFEL